MKVVIAMRNGEEKLRVMAEVRNGILRSGVNILINADKVPAGRMDWLKAQMKKGQITPEIEAWGMHIGDNGNGLVVRWLEDIEQEKREAVQAAYNALPADEQAALEERKAIEKLYGIADKALNYDTDEDNVSRSYSTRTEADRRLEAWQKNYPKAARRERARDMDSQADREENLAVGALTYDADGWISPEEQKQRHDEGMVKAADLRAEAQKLRETC